METGQVALCVNFSLLLSPHEGSLATVRSKHVRGDVVFSAANLPRAMPEPKVGQPKLVIGKAASTVAPMCSFLSSRFLTFFIYHALRCGYHPSFHHWLVGTTATNPRGPVYNGFVAYSSEWEESEMLAALLALKIGVSVPSSNPQNSLPLVISYHVLVSLSPKDLASVAAHAQVAGAIILRHLHSSSAGQGLTMASLMPTCLAQDLLHSLVIDQACSLADWGHLPVQHGQVMLVDYNNKGRDGTMPWDTLIALVARLNKICETRAGRGASLPIGLAVTATSASIFKGCAFQLLFDGGAKNDGWQALRRLLTEEKRYQTLLRQMSDKLQLLAKGDALGPDPTLQALFRTMSSAFTSSSFFSSNMSSDQQTFSSSDVAARSPSTFVWPTISSYLAYLVWEVEEDIPSIITAHGGILTSGAEEPVTHFIDVPGFDSASGLAAAIPFSILSEEDSSSMESFVAMGTADPAKALLMFTTVFESLTRCRQVLQKAMQQIRGATSFGHPSAGAQGTTSATKPPQSEVNGFSDRDFPQLEGIVDLPWVRQCVRHWRLFPPVLSKHAFQDGGAQPTSGNSKSPLTVSHGTVLSREDAFIISCASDIWDLIKEQLPPSASIEGWLKDNAGLRSSEAASPALPSRKAQVRAREDSGDEEEDSQDSSSASTEPSTERDTRPPARKKGPIAQIVVPSAPSGGPPKMKVAMKSAQAPPARPVPIPRAATSSPAINEPLTLEAKTPAVAELPFNSQSMSFFDQKSPVYYQLTMAVAMLPPYVQAGTPLLATSTRHLPFTMGTVAISDGPGVEDPVGWWADALIAPYAPFGYLSEWWLAQGLPIITPAVIAAMSTPVPGKASTSQSLIAYAPMYITVAYQPGMEGSGRQPFLLGFRRGRGLDTLATPPALTLSHKGPGKCMCDHVADAEYKHQAKLAVLAQDARGELNLWYKAKANEAKIAAKRVLDLNEQLQASQRDMHSRCAALLKRVASLEEELTEERNLREATQVEAETIMMRLTDYPASDGPSVELAPERSPDGRGEGVVVKQELDPNDGSDSSDTSTDSLEAHKARVGDEGNHRTIPHSQWQFQRSTQPEERRQPQSNASLWGFPEPANISQPYHRQPYYSVAYNGPPSVIPAAAHAEPFEDSPQVDEYGTRQQARGDTPPRHSPPSKGMGRGGGFLGGRR